MNNDIQSQYTQEQLLELLEPFREQYTALGQEHLFHNLDKVSLSNLQHLYTSLNSFSLPFLLKSLQSFQNNVTEHVLKPYHSHGLDLSRLDDVAIYSHAIQSLYTKTPSQRLKFLRTHRPSHSPKISEPSQDDLNYYFYIAMEALMRGQGSSVLLAGGQGSRLKFERPKALFPVESPSDQTLLLRTLYNHHIVTQLAKNYHDMTYGKNTIDHGDDDTNNNTSLPPHLVTLLDPTTRPTSSESIKIPLIILTSPQTHEDISAYLENLQEQITTQQSIPFVAPPNSSSSNSFTPPLPVWITDDLIETVYYIQQTALPAITTDGKLVLSNDRLLMSPNGNGGLYNALFPLLDGLKEGSVVPPYPKPTGNNNTNDGTNNNNKTYKTFDIKHIMCLNIDNICNKVCDPMMLGYTITHNSQIGVKTIPKTTPSERVGVLAEKDGKVQVIEYTEIKEAADERDERGMLRYIDGNTNIIIYSTAFLQEAKAQLCAAMNFKEEKEVVDEEKTAISGMPLHHANKEAKIYHNSQRMGNNEDEDEKTINLIKFELFAFDSFIYANDITIIRTNRHNHFLPMKSVNHSDPNVISPDTPRYCLNLLNKIAVMSLLRSGYTIYDTNNARIINPFAHNGDDNEPLDQMGFKYSLMDKIDQKEQKDGEVTIALDLASYGRGIEFDITQFYGYSYPALNSHQGSVINPNVTIFEQTSNQVTLLITNPPSDANKVIHLSTTYGLIIHADGTVTRIE